MKNKTTQNNYKYKFYIKKCSNWLKKILIFEYLPKKLTLLSKKSVLKFKVKR